MHISLAQYASNIWRAVNFEAFTFDGLDDAAAAFVSVCFMFVLPGFGISNKLYVNVLPSTDFDIA